MKKMAINPINRIVLFLLIFVLVVSSCEKNEVQPKPVVGEKAPGFNLASLAGNQTKLSDYNNQVVVLFFISYNCSGCLYGAPLVENDLVNYFSSHTDFQVLGLDMGNGNENALGTFKTATGITFPLLMNASEVGKNYQTSYDALIVLDKSGTIVFKGEKSAAVDLEDVVSVVEMLLGL